MTLRTGNKRSNPAVHGFTLVELMLVMTLLVIVLAIAAPSLGNFFHGRSLESEARRILALTRHAQERAISEGLPMLLWIDEKERRYGLEEQASYSDIDPKAIEFVLDKNLELEVISEQLLTVNNQANTLTPGATFNSIAARRAQAQLNESITRNVHRNLPAIRFQPDGTIGDNSPQALRVKGLYEEALWVALSTNRLNYEIRQETNRWARR